MRIVIDMQGAQAGNRQRGIGRYVMALTRALVKHRGHHEIVLALNGAFADTIEPLRAAFGASLGQDAIRVWDGVRGVAAVDEGAAWRREAAELVRETFLASLRPDVVLVSSLFEGLADDAVTSIGALGVDVPTAVILYDLIPLIQRQPYLDNPVIERWYEGKLGHLRRAGLMLAISSSSRTEALDYLDVPAHACINISTAADSHFVAGVPSDDEAQSLRAQYGLRRPFLMYTGGIDHRKNVEGLIRAYALLTPALRQQHQLAIVCSIEPAARERLTGLARSVGLRGDELVLTGYVAEADLLALYQLCAAFVFPSSHEGFGLPALEAMSCGRAVIAADTSSLPEVVGRPDALFDPHSDSDMADKIARVLGDAAFRADLEQYGLQRAKLFSWDASASAAIAALEQWHGQATAALPAPGPAAARRPRLAFVSPLPPARSGIADYSAELLPELARHYQIDVIVEQPLVATAWIRANCGVRDSAYLLQHAASYDRVLYHFGNSDHHQHMFTLLEVVPGVVVLHDFYLSGICAHMEVTGARPGYWARALYASHGYGALRERFNAADTADVVWAYPCNLPVLQAARQVIVHSISSRLLAAQWYGAAAGRDWAVIPLLRVAPLQADRPGARGSLGLAADAFVVCSFGMLGPSKLNHRLLAAWLASPLAADPRCQLVFVGENPAVAYGTALHDAIRAAGNEIAGRIRITGWTDMPAFRQWLAAADVGVQLRTRSRGETSAAVLDCMNYALPTIVNANGSMADLPDDGVCKLADAFTDAQLGDALTSLWRDPAERAALGERGRRSVRALHAPRRCADQYAEAIEAAYAPRAGTEAAFTAALSRLESPPAADGPWIEIAAAAAHALPLRPARRQLLIDISELAQRDARSGIQRVVRSILRELLANPPEGYLVEPVYATEQHGYRYARRYTQEILGCPPLLDDAVVDYQPGDLFLGLDLQPHVVPAQRHFFKTLRNHGVKVMFVVYDLLPVTLPESFAGDAALHHSTWLEVITSADGAICISAAVASDLRHWMDQNAIAPLRPFDIGVFHLGADIAASAPSTGLPDDAEAVLTALGSSASFLMVGTVEPRKAHAQALDAFELLWQDGTQVNLVIVGKQGWLVDPLARRLRGHAELGKRLFWLEAISDEYLERVYAACACLLAVSLGEGFGLPLIEAAQYGLPIIARNIPVFVEVAGQHAFYFNGTTDTALAQAVQAWLHLYRTGGAPSSKGMPWLTWADSASQLLGALGLRASSRLVLATEGAQLSTIHTEQEPYAKLPAP